MIIVQPLMIRKQRREDLGYALTVAYVEIVFPLAPRHNVRARCARVEAREFFASVILFDLAAYEAVNVLMRIEVVERILKIEHTRAVFAEHEDERRIPHEGASVECSVDKVADKSASGRRAAQIAEGDLPSLVVASDRVVMSFPHRLRETVPSLLVCRQRRVLGLSAYESVLTDVCTRRVSPLRIRKEFSHDSDLVSFIFIIDSE